MVLKKKMPSKSQFADVPVKNGPFEKMVLDKIWDNHLKNPAKKAFINADNPEDNITWEQLYVYSHSISHFLDENQFGKGDVCCVVLPNCWQYATIFLGASLCNGAMSGASAMFTPYELERQFIDSQCSVVFTDEAHLETVTEAAEKAKKVNVIVCIRDSSSPLPPKTIDFAQVLRYSPIAPVKKDFNADDLLLLPYSSGTTGSPKGVQLTHRNFGTMMNAAFQHFQKEINPIAMPVYQSDKENVLLLLPFYHVYGFGLLMKNIFDGSTGIVLSKFDPIMLCTKIQEYKIKQLFLVPPIIIFLAKHPIVDKFDLSSLTMIITGAAPCGKDIAEEFLKRHKNITFLGQGYGMTECGMVSHLPVPGPNSYSAAGKLVSNFEQKIIDVKTGKECANGERGEIWVRGPTVMKGYLNRPEATAETVDKEKWLHTGDIGYLDNDGTLFVVDRLKELIKVKGLQVAPAELEDLLLSHPNIADAAVIGIPDKKSGEAPKAFVVRVSDKLTEKDVADFVKSKVSSYKQLTGGVEFVDEIPKAPSGKILRRTLRDREAAKGKLEKSKL